MARSKANKTKKVTKDLKVTEEKAKKVKGGVISSVRQPLSKFH